MSDNDEKILSAELNHDELKNVSGGHKCSTNRYTERCDATVENGWSMCWSHDACSISSVHYHEVKSDDESLYCGLPAEH